MPLHIDPKLLDALVKREVARIEWQRPDTTESSVSPSTLNPTALALIGGAADGASTFNFLHKGTNVEDNSMYKPLKGNPLATGLAVAGTGIAGATLVKKILGKRFPALADALIANQSANQIGLAGRNVSPDGPDSSAQSYNHSITQAIRRAHGQ